MSYTIERYQTDVLVIGGGLSGAMAALQAREHEAKVIVLEKANTYRSGNAGSGLDHIYSYVPPVHEKVGYTKELMKKDMVEVELMGLGLGNKELTDHFVETSYERVLSLEKYGLNFRYEKSHLAEGFRLVPQFHTVPTSFHFEGRDVKVKLTEAMQKAGVQIINHAQAIEVLKDEQGNAAGAIALSTREDKLLVVEAKTTIIATSGGAARLSENFNTTHDFFEGPSAANCGYGVTLAMNAGAEVVNLEFYIKNGGLAFPGFNFTAGAPGGTWWPAGRVIDDEGNVIVERVIDYDINEPDYLKKNVDQMNKYARQKVSMGKYMAEGKQLYVDLAEATAEEVEYIKWSMFHEGKCWLYLQNLKEDKIDLHKVKIPFQLKKRVAIHGSSTGAYVNVKCETTVNNLYAAGDAIGGAGQMCAPGAVVFGYEAGLQAAEKAKTISEIPGARKEQIEKILQKAEEIRSTQTGEEWRNVQSTLQSIIGIFGVYPLSDNKIDTALALIDALSSRGKLKAADAHELTRSFEVLSLIETARAIFTAAKLRKENLGPFKRYPDDDRRIYGERVAPKDGVLPRTEIYGLYRDDDGSIKVNTHINEEATV